MSGPALDIAATQMAKLSIAQLQVISENRNQAKSELNGPAKSSPRAIPTFSKQYLNIPSKVKSIRKSDDNLFRRSKQFEAQYRQALEKEIEEGRISTSKTDIMNYPISASLSMA